MEINIENIYQDTKLYSRYAISLYVELPPNRISAWTAN